MGHKITIGVLDKRLGPGEHTIPLVVPGQINPKGLRSGEPPDRRQIMRAIRYAVFKRRNKKRAGLSSALSQGIPIRSSIQQ